MNEILDNALPYTSNARGGKTLVIPYDLIQDIKQTLISKPIFKIDFRIIDKRLGRNATAPYEVGINKALQRQNIPDIKFGRVEKTKEYIIRKI